MRVIRPRGLPEPRGYNHGMLGRGGVLFIAGQCAYGPEGEIATDDFVDQFDRALAKVLAVVRAAGGRPSDVGQLTIFVTSMEEYLAARPQLGPRWRARMGRHYPAIALVGVRRLVHPRAKVEIQGWAVLSRWRR